MAATTSTALLASVFINSLGINTHVDYTTGAYSNRTNTINAIKYLGVKNLRDSPESSRAFTIWPQVSQAVGGKFIAYMPRLGPSDMEDALQRIPQLKSLGVLSYVEGANEPDVPAAIAKGNSLSYGANFQVKVFNMGRAQGLPVINMSPGAGWTAADGWQGNYDNIGNLAAYADYANAHTYPAVANGLPYKTVDRLNELAQLAAIGKSVIITEMGWNTATNSQTTVATNMLNGLMDAALLRNPRTYLFALFDDVSGNWGLMNADATPRVAGKALHNLVTLLGGGSASKAGSLTYELTGASTERSVLFQKQDNAYWLAVWDEVPGARTLTLKLPAAATRLAVYDPLNGTTAVKEVGNAASIAVSVDNRPMLIQIVLDATTQTASADKPVAAPVTAPVTAPASAPAQALESATTGSATLTSYASNSTINLSTTTNTVRLYGTGNTVNGGSATYELSALAGGNTINTGRNKAILTIAGSSNTVNVTSDTRIYDSGSYNTIQLARPGNGMTNIYGYIFSKGTKLRLTALMSETTWNGDKSILSRYLTLVFSGSTAILRVNPTGAAGGTTYDMAMLHDYAGLTLSQVIANSVF
jgi:hypothetical protein